MKVALRWLPAFAWAALLFSLSAQSKLPEPPMAFDGIDKLEHAIAYGVLCALIVFAFGVVTRRSLIAAVLLTSLYGASDEIHQMFTPGRSPDVVDWVADTAGACLCVAGLALWRKRRDQTV